MWEVFEKREDTWKTHFLESRIRSQIFSVCIASDEGFDFG
jgi:hypothetical protein